MAVSNTTKKKRQSKSPKKRKTEHLSTKDIEELMGVHMDTYERRRGAVRRK